MPLGFSFGGSKKKESSTSTATTSSTTTPTVPDWLQQQTKDLLGTNNRLAGANPLDYVAGSNVNLDRAGTGATNLSGTPWAYDAAGDLARGASNTGWTDSFVNGDGGAGAKGSSYIKDYMNPFERDVVGATVADLDISDGKTRAQQALTMARNGAFGGSGAALTQSATEGELARARAASLGDIRSRGFETAVQAGQGDAGRYLADQAQRFGFGISANNQKLDAARSISDNATAFGANERANIATQMEVGNNAREIENAQRQAPLDLASWNIQNMPPWLAQFFGSQENGTQKVETKGKAGGISFDVLGRGK